jgi:hypothetical protein
MVSRKNHTIEVKIDMSNVEETMGLEHCKEVSAQSKFF